MGWDGMGWDGMGWDGMGSSDHRSNRRNQPRKPMVPSVRGSRGALLLDGVRTRSHPEHPGRLPSSHPAARSTEACNDKSLSHISGFHVAAGSEAFPSDCRHPPLDVHPCLRPLTAQHCASQTHTAPRLNASSESFAGEKQTCEHGREA